MHRLPIDHRRREAVSLAEFGVAFAILAVLLSILYGVWYAQRRHTSQLERGSEIVQAASLCREALTSDLLRSLPISVLPEDLVTRGRTRPSLALPIVAGYRRLSTPSPEFRLLSYTFDPKRGMLSRAGRPLIAGGLTGVSFRWTLTTPTMVEVVLTGSPALTGPVPTAVVRLLAPERTDPSGHWVFAAHHTGARPVD